MKNNIIIVVIIIVTIFNTLVIFHNNQQHKINLYQHEIQHSKELLGERYLPYNKSFSLKQNMNRISYGTLNPNLKHRCNICNKPYDTRLTTIAGDPWYKAYCRCNKKVF